MWPRAFACAWVRLDNVGACATELRENARAMFLAKPVGLSDRRIVGPVPGIIGVTQTFSQCRRVRFWGLAREFSEVWRDAAHIDA